MPSVNKAILIGHVGKDPEIRYTQSGQGVANFSIATSENWTDNNNKRQQKTTWHRIVAWGKLAEVCKEYLRKGRQVYIEGKLTQNKYTAKDGVERTSVEIVANQLVMLGPREDQQPSLEESIFGGKDPF